MSNEFNSSPVADPEICPKRGGGGALTYETCYPVGQPYFLTSFERSMGSDLRDPTFDPLLNSHDIFLQKHVFPRPPPIKETLKLRFSIAELELSHLRIPFTEQRLNRISRQGGM